MGKGPALTRRRNSLKRYVTYEPKNECFGEGLPADGKAAEPARSAPSLRDQAPATRERSESANRVSPAADGMQSRATPGLERLPGAMADLHLSGSDPRMFPGILTRDHRSGSLRNLTQADDWPVDSSEAPGEEDDM